MGLRIIIFILGIVGGTVAEAVELTEEFAVQKSQGSIQHLPRDLMVSIFSFVDYPTLGKSRRVCKAWRTVIAGNLPAKQKYTLKLISEFPKNFKTFKEMFLRQLPNKPTAKTVLDDIIQELQEDLGISKEQAYQALLDTKLVKSCPSMDLLIYVDGKLKENKKLVFPYICADLFKQTLEATKLGISMQIAEKDKDITQIFGFNNLPIELLVKVTEMDLNHLNLSRLPGKIQRLLGLTRFHLSNTKLSSIPTEIGQLTNLQTLDLRNNQLKMISSEIRQLTNLQTLDLRNNQLKMISSEIRQLTKLHELFLQDNQLISIPSDLDQLTNLQRLYLSNNQLKMIPSGIGELTNLQKLWLNSNQLTSIPSEIGQLTNLQELALENNLLSSIPAEITQLTKLQELYLYNNRLTIIPSEIGQLVELRGLFLQNNHLMSIPSEIRQLTNLRYLYLENNYLGINQTSGILPEIKRALPNCQIIYR